MSFWGKAGGAFKTVGRGAVKVGKGAGKVGLAIAPTVGVPLATVIGGPPLGQAVALAVQMISGAERKYGNGHGAAKHAEVASDLLPLILASIEAGTGREMVDEMAMKDGVDQIIAGLVKIGAARVNPTEDSQ